LRYCTTFCSERLMESTSVCSVFKKMGTMLAGERVRADDPARTRGEHRRVR
jgi:hypothetical protein